MQPSRQAVAAAAFGAAGLVLLLLESIRALTGAALGTAGITVLYLGVGLIALGGILATAALWRAPRPDAGSQLKTL